MIFSIIILFIILFAFSIYFHYFPTIPKPKYKNYPYAILLGCPSHNDGSYSTSQIKRCQLAIEAYKQHKFKTLIISGGSVQNKYAECEQMKKYIKEKIDMPILCEPKASNTFENIQFSKEITGERPVLILTSHLHAKRACAIAKQFYKEYSCCYYSDHKIKHIFREIISRIKYIQIEIRKK